MFLPKDVSYITTFHSENDYHDSQKGGKAHGCDD